MSYCRPAMPTQYRALLKRLELAGAVCAYLKSVCGTMMLRLLLDVSSVRLGCVCALVAIAAPIGWKRLRLPNDSRSAVATTHSPTGSVRIP